MIEKQTIALPFAAGVDTKTDPKLVESPSLAALQNGVLTKPGRIAKREGSVALTNSVIDGTTIDNIEAQGRFRDELLSFKKDVGYSYSEQASKHINKGSVSSCATSLTKLSYNQKTSANTDYDLIGNLSVCAWDTYNERLSQYSVFASVFDESSKTFLTSEVSLKTDAFRPMVFAMGQYFYVFYADRSANAIKYRRLSLAAPTSFESEQTLSSGTIAANQWLFDIDRLDLNRVSIVYDNGTRICFGIFDGSLSSPTFSVDTSTTTERADLCLAVHVEPTTLNSWITYYRLTTSELRYYIFSSTLSVVLTHTDLGTDAYPYVEAITGEFDSPTQLKVFYQCGVQTARTFAPADVTTGTDTITLLAHKFVDGQKVRFSSSTTLPAGLSAGVDYYVIVMSANTFKVATSLQLCFELTAVDITSQGTGTHTVTDQGEATSKFFWSRDVRTNTCTSAGVSGTPSVLLRNTGIASRAFLFEETKYFFAWQATANQYQFFLVKQDGSIVGKSLYDRAYSRHIGTSAQSPSKVSELPDGSLGWATVFKSQFLGSVTINAVARVDVDFNTVEKYFNEDVGTQAVISGSFVSTYDGSRFVESGFHTFPDSLNAVVTTGGPLSAGTYQYAVAYSWVDAAGNAWTSAPSVVSSIAGVGGSGNVTILVPSLVHTKKTSPNGEASIDLYLSEAGGTLLYKLSSVQVKYENDSSFNSSTKTALNDPTKSWCLIRPFVNVSSAEPGLYTDSGELENTPPPPTKFLSRSKNRVFLVNSEDPQEVWFSKYNYGNNAIVFNDTLTKRLNGWGDVRCVQPMDDKVVLFTDRTIHFFSGDGPLDTGEQDTFREIDLVTSDTGCDNPNSLVEFPEGILFQSPKGYYKLGRDLSVEYIGAPVEAFNSNVCSSATLLTDRNQVRFTSKDGAPTLVYDYFTKQWSTFTNHDANDSIQWKNQFVYARQSGGNVYVQTEDVWNDNGTTYPLKLETPWIRVKNIQNFQRVRKLFLLGEFKSDHKLKIQIAYDFQDGYVDTVTWDAGAAIDASLLGSEAVLGDGTLLGGQSEGVYQCSIHIPRQRCEAIKFLIEDVNDGDLLESYNISHMALEVGLKQGTYKLRSEKTAGS